MGDIYRHCKEVLIYLATERFPAGRKSLTWDIFEYRCVESLDDIDFKRIISDLVLLFDPNSTWRPLVLFYSVMIATVYLLCQHPWFYRGWVIQEVVLAPRATTLSCGQQINLEALLGLIDITICGDRDMLVIGESLRYLSSAHGHLRIQRMLKLKSSHDPLHILDTASSGSQFRLDQNYVFGFLSMMNLDLTPDYDMTRTEVFTQAATKIIEADRSLRILTHLHRDLRENTPIPLIDRCREQRLPSWVPCWSNPRAQQRLWPNAHGENDLKICKHRRHERYTLTLDQHILGVRGGRIGQVRTAFHRWDTSQAFNNSLAFMQALFASVREEELHSLSYQSERLLRDLLVVFENDFGLDWPQFWNVIKPRDAFSKEAWPRHLKHVPYGSSTYQGRLSQLHMDDKISERFPEGPLACAKKLRALRCPPKSMRYDKVGKTSTYLAIGPERRESLRKHLERLQYYVQRDVDLVLVDGRRGRAKGRQTIRKGDIICILHGLHCPIILRSSGTYAVDGIDKPTFKIIDVCDMDGGVDDSAVTWEEHEAEEFRLS